MLPQHRFEKINRPRKTRGHRERTHYATTRAVGDPDERDSGCREAQLRELGVDFENVIREKGLTNAWNGTVETFRLAAELQPWVVWNGYLDGFLIPNHLAAQGFYLLRARTQLREISNILLK